MTLHFLRKFSSTRTDNNVRSEINLARHLVRTYYAKSLREYRLIVRFECHKPSLFSPDLQRGLPIASYFCHPVPLFLISWTSQDDGHYDSPRKPSLSLHVFFTHFFNISFKGACSPLNGITDMKTMSILSSVAEEACADKLPAVVSPGGLCSTTFSNRSISVFIDKFYALQNGPPNGSQQIFMWTTLCNSLMPPKTPFRPVPSPSPFLP